MENFNKEIRTLSDKEYNNESLSIIFKVDLDSVSIFVTNLKTSEYYNCELTYNSYIRDIKNFSISRSTTPKMYFSIIQSSLSDRKCFIEENSLILPYTLDKDVTIDLVFDLQPIHYLVAKQVFRQVELIKQIKQKLIDEHTQEIKSLRKQTQELQVEIKATQEKEDEDKYSFLKLKPKKINSIHKSSSLLHPNTKIRLNKPQGIKFN